MKINYGFDGPEEIYKLLLIGAIFASIGALSAHSLEPQHHLLAQLATGLGILSAIGCLAVILLMLLSSKFRKANVWKTLINSLDLKGDELILDVGCGHGLQLLNAAKQLTTGKAIGIDIWRHKDQFNNSEETTLKNARQLGVVDKIDLITSDMRNMQFNDNHFDVAFASMSICNLNTHNERAQAVSEITRVLKPGGRLIILDCFYTTGYIKALKKAGWQDIKRSNWRIDMFPPVRIITASKPRFLQTNSTKIAN